MKLKGKNWITKKSLGMRAGLGFLERLGSCIMAFFVFFQGVDDLLSN
jgi:hypothetical protein